MSQYRRKQTPFESPCLFLIAMCLIALIGLPTVWAEEDKAVAVPESRVDPGDTGAILPLQGEITDVMAESLRRRIEDAVDKGAAVIVFDMDTPGGLVTSSIAIADMVRELEDVKTIAWVNPNAHSGGSIVAVACDEIVMTRSSRIGDSQVIMGGPTGAGAVPEELQPKAYTPVLADFRQSARLNGYSQVLSEAFVLPDREVWWIEHKETGERKFVFGKEKISLVGGEATTASGKSADESSGDKTKDESTSEGATPKSDSSDTAPVDETIVENATYEWQLAEMYHDIILDREVEVIQPVVRRDQLLEMSAGEAHAYGFSKAIVSDVSVLTSRYSLSELVRFDRTWSESLAYFMTSMWVRGFLMIIIMLGAYVEFNTPGVGVPGLTALICLSIFVGAPYLAGLANIWEIVVIVIGVALMALEIFVIPGFGVAGISGIALFLAGIVYTFVPEEPGQGFPIFIPELPETMIFLKRGLVTVVGAMITSLIGMVMLSYYLPKTPFFRRVVPANPMPSEVAVQDVYSGAARIGDIGQAVGPLRPAGKVRFDAMLVDVVTQGEYLEPGEKVEVVERRGNHVVVRSANA